MYRMTGFVLVGLGAVVAGLLSVSVPQQFVFSALLLLVVVVAGGPSSWMTAAVVISMCSGLARRLLAGPTGRIDNDPLVIVPLILFALAAAVGFIVRARGARSERTTLVFLLMPGFVALSVVATGRTSVVQLYAAAGLCLPWLVMAAVMSGVLPDMWATVQRILPSAALVVGVYGVVQFLVLPSWDRSWMITSRLTSIGLPEPFGVRVFGMSDSPGPYAVLLGIAVVVGAHRAVSTTGTARLLWVGWCLALVVPLVLSGVRLALLGVLVAALVASSSVGRGAARLVPLVVVAGAGLVVTQAVGAFGSTSTVLNANRLTSFNAGTDPSVQARLNLASQIPAGLSRPFGSALSGGADNLLVDILSRYGPFAALSALLSLVLLGVRSWRQLRSSPERTAPLVSLYLLVISLGGNFLVSSVGVIASVAFASVLAAPVPSARSASAVSADGGASRRPLTL